MRRLQRLESVCNGGHLYSAMLHDGYGVYTPPTAKDVQQALEGQTKAIYIAHSPRYFNPERYPCSAENIGVQYVDPLWGYRQIWALLDELSKAEAPNLRARKLCGWSRSGDLWIIRNGEKEHDEE